MLLALNCFFYELRVYILCLFCSLFAFFLLIYKYSFVYIIVISIASVFSQESVVSLHFVYGLFCCPDLCKMTA